MRKSSDVSRKTLLFRAFLSLLSGSLSLSSSYAGTLGTESETERLQAEVTDARNALDAALLEKGAKPDDPKVKAKAAVLDEKMKAFKKSFQESLTPPQGPKTYKGSAASSPSRDHSVPIRPAEPETVLSGEGIQNEIAYPKKPTPGKNPRPIPRLSPKITSVVEEIPANTSAPDISGLSEMQYGKPAKKLKPSQ